MPVNEPLHSYFMHVMLRLNRRGDKKPAQVRYFKKRDRAVFLPKVGYTLTIEAGSFKKDLKVLEVGGSASNNPAGPYDLYLTPIGLLIAKAALVDFVDDAKKHDPGYGWIEEECPRFFNDHPLNPNRFPSEKY